MNKLLATLPPALKKNIRKKRMPSFEQPMLATLTKNYFSDKNWIYEHKFDGIRCLLFKNKNRYTVKSRNNNILNNTYPELIDALKQLKVDQIILDGEIVTFGRKASSFEKLQQRIGVKNPSAALMKKIKIYIYIFDILYLDGYDLTELPLLERKRILKRAITFKPPLRYTVYKSTHGIPLFKHACKKGWEGVIAKHKESAYIHKRSQNWLKFKCVQEQELVIAGYTEPERSRIGFGALLVGYYKGNKLMYAGKVGTGYNDDFLTTFIKKLQRAEIKTNPFANKHAIKDKKAHFVSPKFVGEFGFEEWTKDNKLRHPRFLGMRYDKNPKKVVKETPKNIIPKL